MTLLVPAANRRIAAMLAGHCCNQQQIFNQQRPKGDVYKLGLDNFKFNFLTRFCGWARRFSNTSPATSRHVVGNPPATSYINLTLYEFKNYYTRQARI